VVSLTERDLGELLSGFQRSAFRFEIRDRYNSDVGREPFRKFLAGEPDDLAWHRPWLEMLRRDLADGKSWQRVRIVSVPLSDWSRYALGAARLSVEAGDDIRYLSRVAAAALDLRPADAWILDDRQLVVLRFSPETDTFLGADLAEDESVVQQHRYWRDLSWAHAQPLEEFVRSVS
jgi:hypothetical protein